MVRAVGLSRVAVRVAIAVVVVAVVAVITFVIPIPIPIMPSAMFTPLRIVIQRIGDAAGQANQGGRKRNQ